LTQVSWSIFLILFSMTNFLPFTCHKVNNSGILSCVGMDEVGRGCLAGPVVVAGVALEDPRGLDIADSKTISKKRLREAAIQIAEKSDAYYIIAVGHRRINELNILRATLLGFSLIKKRLVSHRYLIDGNQTIPGAEAIIGGDKTCHEISAASIIAKVYRDALMAHLDSIYPGYGLAQHVGYPSRFHREQVLKIGKSPIHRNFKVRLDAQKA